MKIIADGAADLPAGFAAAYDVGIVPLSVIFGQETFRSDVELDADRFYRMLAESKHHPTTSQPTPADFVAAYEAARDEGHTEVISIHLSSALSGTYNAASQGAAMVEGLRVSLVDTRTLSLAQGFQVMVAAAAARAGRPRDEILKRITETGRDTELFFTLDTLDYLIKGGRIGRVQGMVGSLLGIRPVITVDKEAGIYTPVGTGRTLKKAMQTLADKVAEAAGGNPARVAILHANSPDLVAAMEELIRERLSPLWLATVQITPTLGVHTGPRGIGVAVARGDWPAGLDIAA